MSAWENLTGVEGAQAGYLGKRFSYARKESKKGIRWDFIVPLMEEIGLERYIPQRPVAADAFRRACQDIGKKYHYDADGKKYKVTVVMIDESADPIIRNIQVTEIDRKNKTSTEGKLVAQIQFSRATEYVTAYYGYEAGYEFESCPEFVMDRISAAISRYLKECSLVSEQQLHNIVQRILQDAGNPVNKIPSTWNIPITREELLNKLLILAERLNEYEKDIFVTDTLPVVSSDAMVTEKFKNDAVVYAIERLNTLYAKAKDDISTARNVEKATERATAQLKAEGERVMSLIEEYETILGQAMDEVRQAKQLTEDKLKEFVESPEQQQKHREGMPKRRIRSASQPVAETKPAVQSEAPAPVRKIRPMKSIEDTQNTQIALNF